MNCVSINHTAGEMIDYKRDIRFGYGPQLGGKESTMSMPKTNDERYPKLTSSKETVPMVVRGRSHYIKFAKAKDQVGYKREVDKYYANNHDVYTENALSRLSFTAKSRFGFFERLVYFWENHFSIMTGSKTSYTVVVGGYENEAIRPHIDSYFRDLLLAAVTHPAMLLTLDQHASMGERSPVGLVLNKGSNENLGRELLELHTLGVDGGYSQKDVEEMTGLLTGLNVDYDAGITKLYLSRAQHGFFDIMGKRYGGVLKTYSDIKQAIHDLAVHPSTARHIARKLASHFISDDPPQSLVEDMETAFLKSDGFLPDVYKVLIDFTDRDSRFSKVKSPLEFVISGLRAFGTPQSAFANSAKLRLNRTSMMGGDDKGVTQLPDLTIGALDIMGHRLWGPRGPDGWPDNNDHWLRGVSLVQRATWASKAARFAQNTAAEFIDNSLGDWASPELRNLVNGSNSAIQGVTLTLMSPEFNRR